MVKQVTRDDPVYCCVQTAQEEARARQQTVRQKHNNLLSNNYHCSEPGWDLIEPVQKNIFLYGSLSRLENMTTVNISVNHYRDFLGESNCE